MEANHVLAIYKHFKLNFQYQYEDYLNVTVHKKYRSALTQLRLAFHSLRIETGRHGQNCIHRHERICQICSTADIQDEYHFVLACTIYMYNELRVKFISRYYSCDPSVFTFTQLMSSSDTTTINNFSYFIYNAFKRVSIILSTFIEIILFMFRTNQLCIQQLYFESVLSKHVTIRPYLKLKGVQIKVSDMRTFW